MLSQYPASAMLRAENIERAKQFYTDTLGLNLVMDYGGVFLVEAGQGTQIAVYQRDNFPAPQNNVVAWQVEDLTVIAKDLIKRGIEPERYDMPDVDFDELGIANLEGQQTLWFTDSEDNIHLVTQSMT